MITREELSSSLREYLAGLRLTDTQVNEIIKRFAGDKTLLKTVDKSTLVNAINEIGLELENEINEVNSQLEHKANKSEVDTERKRIDNLAKLEEGSTTGDAELVDGRIGVNGKTYNILGDATRESLNAIYNGLGGVYLNDITNVNEYASNSNFGEIINNNTIKFSNVETPYIILTTTSKANRKYLIYCSENIKYIRTLQGEWKDEGISIGNYGLVTPTHDDYKVAVGIDANFIDNPKNVTFYCIDVTGTQVDEDDFMTVDLPNNVNKWLFTSFIKDNIVKPCSTVLDRKVWTSETWEKIDDETVNTPHDVRSTITISNTFVIGKKYMVLFSGAIDKVRTIGGGLWKDDATISNNIATIEITQDADYMVLETLSGGTNNVYCIDITNNEQLEDFIVKYKIDSVFLNYKDKEFTKILEMKDNTITSNISAWEGKKWIAYGDSITAQNSYVQKVAKKLGLEAINKGVGGTTVSDITGSNATAFCRDERINTFDEDADLVTIMGGTNDWDKTTIGDLTYNNGFDTSKFKGALATTIINIQKRCPNATIVVCSLIGGRGVNTGVVGDVPIVDQFGQSSLDFAKATKEVAEFMNVEYCDTWSCGINNWNRVDMIEDSVHPTQTKGTDKIAIKLIGTLKTIEPLT